MRDAVGAAELRRFPRVRTLSLPSLRPNRALASVIRPHMDSRAASHLLHEIVALLELQGEDPAVPAPFADAARSLAADEARPLTELLKRDKRRFAPEVVEVLEQFRDNGDADLLDRLRESTPEGLFEMMRVPGLGPSRIRRIHEGLHH